jgi:RHS repeat-associated protein
LSYAQDPDTQQLKIVEQNHYYPFGLRHTNYSGGKMQVVKEQELKRMAPTPEELLSYKYKYNGKEWQDELGLNMYDYGARNYDAAIGRWMNIDPKAETSRRWNPYTYCYNNPMRFIDPDGMIGQDWVQWKTNDGKNHITYDAAIKTTEQAVAKGYTNVIKVFAQGTAHNDDYTDVAEFAADGHYIINGGERMDVDDTSSTMVTGNTFISENKGIMDAFGEYLPSGLQKTGDAITLAALPVMATGIGAPLGAGMAQFGGIMSVTGAGLEQINDLAEGEFSGSKFVTKAVIETASRKISGADSFGPTEQVVNDNIFNLLDNTLDSTREKK